MLVGLEDTHYLVESYKDLIRKVSCIFKVVTILDNVITYFVLNLNFPQSGSIGS